MFAALAIIPAIVQLIVLPMCPESPKYTLVVKNHVEEAERALKKLRAQDDVSVCMEYGRHSVWDQR